MAKNKKNKNAAHAPAGPAAGNSAPSPMLDAENGVMAKYTDNVRFMAQSGDNNSGALEVLGVDGGWKRAGEWRFDGNTNTLKTPLDEGVELIPELAAQKETSAAAFRDYLAAREAKPVPPQAPPVVVPPQVPEAAQAAGANDAGHESQEPQVEPPRQNPPDLSQQSPPVKQETPEAREVAQATAADKAAVEAQADFDAMKKRRIEDTAAALQQQGIQVNEGRIATLTYVRDAKDGAELAAALNKAMVFLTRELTIKSVGGTEGGGDSVMPGQVRGAMNAQEGQELKDGWKCPSCGSLQGYAYKNDDRQPYEYCRACGWVGEKAIVYGRYDINSADNAQEAQ